MLLHIPLEFLQVSWGFHFLRIIIPFPYLTGWLRKSDSREILYARCCAKSFTNKETETHKSYSLPRKKEIIKSQSWDCFILYSVQYLTLFKLADLIPSLLFFLNHVLSLLYHNLPYDNPISLSTQARDQSIAISSSIFYPTNLQGLNSTSRFFLNELKL